MSDQADVTGRDAYLLVEALTFTVEAPAACHRARQLPARSKHLAHSQLIARRRLGHVLEYGKTNGA